MKWTGLYLVGYVVLLIGGLLALWKSGVLASIGPVWTAIGVVIAIGLGIMMAVANSGEKRPSKWTGTNWQSRDSRVES